MRVYSIAQAKDQLSRLVDEAIAGEQARQAGRGAEAGCARSAGRPSADLIDELAKRAKALPPLGQNTDEIVRRMRDEDP